MDEEEDVGDVEEVGFGVGQGLAHEAPDSPAQRGVEAFEMVGMFFFGLLMELFRRDDVGIGFQSIGKTQAVFVLRGHLGPHIVRGDGVSVSRHPRHNLARAFALDKPQPNTVVLVSNEGPHLV